MMSHACVLSCFSHAQPYDPMDQSPPGASVHGILSPGKNTGMSCHALLQGIFLTQRSNPCLLCLLHWQAGSLPLAPPVPRASPIHVVRCIYIAIQLFMQSDISIQLSGKQCRYNTLKIMILFFCFKYAPLLGFPCPIKIIIVNSPSETGKCYQIFLFLLPHLKPTPVHYNFGGALKLISSPPSSQLLSQIRTESFQASKCLSLHLDSLFLPICAHASPTRSSEVFLKPTLIT